MKSFDTETIMALVNAMAENEERPTFFDESGSEVRAILPVELAMALEMVPDPEPGHWVDKSPDQALGQMFYCSNCNAKVIYPQKKSEAKRCGYKYCPFCGIEMK